MMPKQGPESMTNLWNFGTCNFLFFVKSITLKSFFTWSDVPEIYKKSINNQCKLDARKRDATNTNSYPKWMQNGIQNREKVNPKRGPKIDAKNGTNAQTHLAGRPVGRAAPSNILSISKRLVLVS